jgi:hypothetical protein
MRDAWDRLEVRVSGVRSWLVAGIAAFLAWLLAVLLLVMGVRPLGWVLLGVAAFTLAVVMLYARARALRPSEVVAFSFACIVLEWPLLWFPTLVVLTWVGVAKWE